MYDSVIFDYPPQRVLEAVRDVAKQEPIHSDLTYLLERMGLLQDIDLTEAGRALFKLAWVLRRNGEAMSALGQAVRALVPIQVVEQELASLGPVPEEGVLDLLIQHQAVELPVSVEALRPTWRWLNSVGVLVYSTKMKTVRALAPTPDAALAGEIQAIAAMISPKTPYLNVVKLRRVIRQLRGVVYWVDAHFNARAFEELAEELDTAHVGGLRILSGDGEGILSARSAKDLERFAAEMGAKGVAVEWRVDPRGARDWHDRWLAAEGVCWNVPPVNTLFKNDYSEIIPSSERPPLEAWWERSSPRA
ncbi:hypothetical protein [Serinicoccus marinus]|uniref:hypothetical protein n=1 Tax=Serinicoccus marinus TaxID=247333 RepID=UPI0003B52E04|nr:hypothetical protein [Serinicoccus marinus]